MNGHSVWNFQKPVPMLCLFPAASHFFLGPSAQPNGILHSSYSLELNVPLITEAGLGWTAEQTAQHCWGTESRERKAVELGRMHSQV